MKRWTMIFWGLFPFILFLLGYGIPSIIFNQKTGECPSFVGQTVLDAIKPMSAYPLNVRIVGEEEHDELPQGTILRQQPYPGQRIKPHQSIYLVVSRMQGLPLMPPVEHASLAQLTEDLKKQGVHLKAYELDSGLPKGDIMASVPHSGMVVSDKERTAYVYVSAGNTAMRILPSFKGCSVRVAHEALPSEKVQLKVIRNRLAYDDIRGDEQLTIVEQKPLAGSVVDLSKPLTIYAVVE